MECDLLAELERLENAFPTTEIDSYFFKRIANPKNETNNKEPIREAEQWLNQNQLMMSTSFRLKTSKKNHKNDFSILLPTTKNKSFHPTKSEQKKPFLTPFDTNYRSHYLIEIIPPTHPLRHLISLQMYCIYDPIKWICPETKKNRQATFPPPLWHRISMIIYWICPETKQNRQTISPMTLNTINDTFFPFFPTHSDTHFLCKCVENITPFQIWLSRNKEKQTDNNQMTLFLFQLNNLSRN